MGLKLASGGFPADVRSEEEKKSYVEEMNSFHHTNLEIGDFVKNAVIFIVVVVVNVDYEYIYIQM